MALTVFNCNTWQHVSFSGQSGGGKGMWGFDAVFQSARGDRCVVYHTWYKVLYGDDSATHRGISQTASLYQSSRSGECWGKMGVSQS